MSYTCGQFLASVTYTQLQKKPISHFLGPYGKTIKKSKYSLYTILFYNQLCTKLLNNVTVLRKPVHAVRQGIDKGSFIKMTSFRHWFSLEF